MRGRLWVILWVLASLIWLSLPLLCEVVGGDERLLSCRDGVGIAVDALVPLTSYPKWVFKFATYLLWFGPPVALLLLMLAARSVVRRFRHNT